MRLNCTSAGKSDKNTHGTSNKSQVFTQFLPQRCWQDLFWRENGGSASKLNPQPWTAGVLPGVHYDISCSTESASEWVSVVQLLHSLRLSITIMMTQSCSLLLSMHFVFMLSFLLPLLPLFRPSSPCPAIFYSRTALSSQATYPIPTFIHFLCLPTQLCTAGCIFFPFEVISGNSNSNVVQRKHNVICPY